MIIEVDGFEYDRVAEWKRQRHEIALSVLSALIGRGDIRVEKVFSVTIGETIYAQSLALCAVGFADALIEALDSPVLNSSGSPAKEDSE